VKVNHVPRASCANGSIKKRSLLRLGGDHLFFQKLFVLIVLVILTVAGFYLRWSYARSTSPYIDEYTTMWVAQRTVEHGYPIFSTGSIYSQGMLFTYLDALFFRLFQFSELVARMPSLIISVFTIPCVYWVGKKMFSAYEGLIAAAIVTFAPQAVLWGGRARNYALIQLIVLWATYLFYRWVIAEDGDRYGWLFVLTFIAAAYTHNVAMLVYPAFLVCAFLGRGWRWFFQRKVIVAHVLVFTGVASSFYLYRRMRPTGWSVVGVGRGEIAPSFDPLGALERYKPFFVGLDDVPFAAILTVLCILGIGYVLWTALKRRGFTAMLSSRDEGAALAYLAILFGAIMFEMVFIVTDRRWSPRYLFMDAPLFYLIAVGVLFRIIRLAQGWLAEREWLVFLDRSPWRDRAKLIGTALAVLAIGVVSWPAATAAVAKGEYGYDLAFQYVRERRQPGDTVMTFALSPCVIYLGEEGCDYVAIQIDFHSYAIQRDGQWIEAWAGVPILITDEELVEVIESSPRAWFVVDESRFRTRYTDYFIQYVWDRMELVAKEGGVFVFLSESPPPPPLAIQRSLYYNLGDKVALLGYGLSAADLHPGDVLELSLRWQGLTHILQNYSVFVHLVDAEGRMWAQHDGVPQRELHPTTHWVEGEIISDPRELLLPQDLPHGRYRLQTGMYLPQTMEHLPVFRDDGDLAGEAAVLDYVRVAGDTPEALAPDEVVAFNLGNEVTLSGYDLEVSGTRPGSTVHLVLYWRAERQIDEDYTVFVHLVDADGRISGQQDNEPEGGFYRTSFWDVGEVVRDEHELTIDADAMPGEHWIEIGMYVLATGRRLTVVNEAGETAGDAALLGTVAVSG
jgi:4-amino-4-deoxy-L-arabinose transferase-like glycosyltransferase